MNTIYDVIVVGAGHAGIEASLAAARMGARTLMLTLNLDHIGQMSCNPAIGGIGKGHLVREIDALGGEMGVAIDETGIQFRFLNTRKGPAVRARRAQADKAAYRARMKRVLEATPNLTIRQASVERVIVEDGAVRAVESQIGELFAARTVILTTGTFLKGLVHIGLRNYNAGRAGDFAAMGLSDSLASLGFRIGRLEDRDLPAPRRPHYRLLGARDSARRRAAAAVLVPHRAHRAAADPVSSDFHQRERPTRSSVAASTAPRCTPA